MAPFPTVLSFSKFLSFCSLSLLTFSRFSSMLLRVSRSKKSEPIETLLLSITISEPIRVRWIPTGILITMFNIDDVHKWFYNNDLHDSLKLSGNQTTVNMICCIGAKEIQPTCVRNQHISIIEEPYYFLSQACCLEFVPWKKIKELSYRFIRH